MNTGSHIPAYLLCERFAKDQMVLNLYPPDEQGVGLLAETARQVVLVQRNSLRHEPVAKHTIGRLVASAEALPFAPGTFDIVLCLALPFDRPGFDLEKEIHALRQQVNPSGFCAVLCPNRETVSPGSPGSRHIPEFLDLERALRRFFPHITMFAQQPLFGATLSPLGRRPSGEAPLLDDRMLPEDGETPDFFLGLCATRYRKFDDTTIAQLPFRPVAEGFRAQLERFEGTISLIQKEKNARDRRIEELLRNADELNDRLAKTELEIQEKAALAAKVTWLNGELARRDEALRELEKKHEEQSVRAIELENEVARARRSERRLEQQIAELERRLTQDLTDREEGEKQLEALHGQMHDAQAELKARVRQLDDAVEEIAAREAELDGLRRESVELRHELVAQKEQNRILSIRSSDVSSNDSIIRALEAELERTRTLMAAEKKRLDQALEEEHAHLLDEIAQKDESRREVHRLELRLRELELAMADSRTHRESRDEDIATFSERIEALQAEKRELLTLKREHEKTIDELTHKVRDRGDELKRQEHAIELLTTRARESEQRSAALQNRLSALEQELSKAESLSRNAQFSSDSLAQLQSRYSESQQQVMKLRGELSNCETRYMELEVKALRLEQLEERYRAAFDQIDVLQREIEELRPEAAVARTLRKRAEQAEALHNEGRVELDAARRELDDARQTISRMEGDLSAAMEALAEIEEGADAKVQGAAERIKAMKSEILRLKRENEAELLLVREDLETELRLAARSLDQSKQEIWELREEVTRLQAQSAASAALSKEEGINADFQGTLLEQESLILELQEERRKLRRDNEKLERSLEVRRRNMRILAAILRREHLENRLLKAGGEDIPALDLRSLIAAEGGDVEGDNLDFLEEPAAEPPAEPIVTAQDDAIVDAIMESVLVRGDKESSTVVETIRDSAEKGK